MAVKIAINGFGRIGRLVLRGIIESGRTDVVPVAINDLGSVEANAHLLSYDSVHGRLPADIRVDATKLLSPPTAAHGILLPFLRNVIPPKCLSRVLMWPWNAQACLPPRKKPSLCLRLAPARLLFPHPRQM